MPDYGITSGLPQLPNTDDKLFGQLLPIYSALNALATKVSIISGLVNYSQAELSQQSQFAGLQSQFQNRLFVKALEPLGWGKIVTLTVDSGKLAASLADCTDATKPAHGVVATPQGIETGQYGEVTALFGFTPGISGSTVGAFYWLSTTGNVQIAPPTTSGNLVQGVGLGLGSAGFLLNISGQLALAP